MPRAVSNTYYLLSQRFPEPEKLSLRKQVCLSFIKWGATKNKEERGKLVVLAKEWRKEPGRIAGHRTLLERKIRKLFKRDKKHRALAPSREGARRWAEESYKKGIGLHSPEQKALTPERNRKTQEKRIRENTNFAGEWVIFPKDGEPFIIRGLKTWVREMGWPDSRGIRHGIGNPNKWYRGYRCERYNREWDEL